MSQHPCSGPLLANCASFCTSYTLILLAKLSVALLYTTGSHKKLSSFSLGSTELALTLFASKHAVKSDEDSAGSIKNQSFGQNIRHVILTCSLWILKGFMQQCAGLWPHTFFYLGPSSGGLVWFTSSHNWCFFLKSRGAAIESPPKSHLPLLCLDIHHRKPWELVWLWMAKIELDLTLFSCWSATTLACHIFASKKSNSTKQVCYSSK
jgi:hypothetical protein